VLECFPEFVMKLEYFRRKRFLIQRAFLFF